MSQIRIIVTQFGQTIEGFDQVFDAGEVVVVLPGEERQVLLQLEEDQALSVGKALVKASRAAKIYKRREAAERSLLDEEEDE